MNTTMVPVVIWEGSLDEFPKRDSIKCRAVWDGHRVCFEQASGLDAMKQMKWVDLSITPDTFLVVAAHLMIAAKNRKAQELT